MSWLLSDKSEAEKESDGIPEPEETPCASRARAVEFLYRHWQAHSFECWALSAGRKGVGESRILFADCFAFVHMLSRLGLQIKALVFLLNPSDWLSINMLTVSKLMMRNVLTLRVCVMSNKKKLMLCLSSWATVLPGFPSLVFPSLPMGSLPSV